MGGIIYASGITETAEFVSFVIIFAGYGGAKAAVAFIIILTQRFTGLTGASPIYAFGEASFYPMSDIAVVILFAVHILSGRYADMQFLRTAVG